MFPIGFGTWPLGGSAYGSISSEQASETITCALENGVRLFDTADIYGDGRVEEILGDTLTDTEGVTVVSKVGYICEASSEQNFSESHIRKRSEESLRRIRKSQHDILLLHSPTAETLADGRAMRILEELLKSGEARRTGVSLRTLDTAALALEWDACSVIEVILNLLDQRAIESGLLVRCIEKKIKVIARVPLCFGFLTGKYEPGTLFQTPDQRARWNRQQVDGWIQATAKFSFLASPNRTLTQGALAFVSQQPSIFSVIPGMKTCTQVRENIGSVHAERRLTDVEINTARGLWPSISHLPPK